MPDGRSLAASSLGAGWRAFRARPRLYLAIFFTLFGSWALLEILVIALQRLGPALNAVLHLGFLVAFSGLKLGFFRLAERVHAGQPVAYRDLFAAMRRGPAFLCGGLAYLAMIAAGLILLVIPGVYLGARYSLFGFSMAAEGSGIRTSFRRSAELTRGALGPLLALGLALLAINLLGAALLGLGLLVSVPVTVLALAGAYRSLAGGEVLADSGRQAS